jgi:hypothetical protein
MKGQRTKGTHVLHVVKILRMNRDRVLELLAPDLHHYLIDRILPSSWYPSDDHLGLLRAVARMMPKGQDPWIAMGRGSARMDLDGAYKQHFRVHDPETTLRVLAAVWRSTHDSGKFVITFDSSRSATFKMIEYPVITDEICRITTGYIIESLHVAGAIGPEVEHATCVALRSPSCTWHAHWKGIQNS